MELAGARLISIDEARALIAPLLPSETIERELMLGEGPDYGGVLLVDGNAVLSDDLRLEWESAAHDGQKFRGIVVHGDLAIAGDIVSTNWDGGPFLVVLGTTHVRHILKRGAPIIFIGPLKASGTIYCEHNHGAFRALGGLSATALVDDDHLCELRGAVDAIVFATRSDDPRAFLLEEFYYEEDDGEAYLIDDVAVALIGNILAEKPVFRAGAPRRT